MAVNTPVPSTPFSPERGYSTPISSKGESAAPSSLPPHLVKPISVPQSKDLSFLLRPSIFHALPPPLQLSSPAPVPPAKTTLPDLLKAHNYRAAAIHCATRLSTPPPPPTDEIISLFYTRLASLIYLSFTQLAAAESIALNDPSSDFYRIPSSSSSSSSSSSNILPWHLRSLVARLASIASNDPRRSVTAFYDLARDARAAIAAQTFRADDAASREARRLWGQRLEDCGLGIANVLVEAGDLEGAGHCLEGMRGVRKVKAEGGGGGGMEGRNDIEVGNSRSEEGVDEAYAAGEDQVENSLLDTRLALVYLALGDVDAAKRCCDRRTTNTTSVTATASMLPPLSLIAEGKYSDAATLLRSMMQQQQQHQHQYSPAVQVNLAVCQFYMGHKDETMTLLEQLVDNGQAGAAAAEEEEEEVYSSSRALTFNLATCLELGCERTVRGKKMELAERVVEGKEGGMDGRGQEGLWGGEGGEWSAADFKL